MGDERGKLDEYAVIREGEAEILMHRSNSVFYNKTQVNNRDMSIAVLRTFISRRKEEHDAYLTKKRRTKSKVHGEKSSTAVKEAVTTEEEPSGVREQDELGTSEEPSNENGGSHSGELKQPAVLEALAASGLRSLRYAREVEGIGKIVALDIDKASIEACRKNIQFNGSLATSKVEAHQADARVYMLTQPKEYDVVDLDPYGSPSVFLDSAVQCVADGGLLMCTATDLAVLCGGNGEVCYAKYGSYPLKGKYCHEMALRILLACIESHANRYKRYIVPIVSVQMDFYIRVFVRIYTSASAIKNTPLKLSYIYQCIGCDSFHLQPLGRIATKNNSVRYAPGFGPSVPQECTDCGKKFNMGGPIWSAPIHDLEWVSSILTSVRTMKERYPAYEKISAVLTTISEELPDVPLFVSLHNLCATLKCTSPSAVIFRSAVINAGYRISGSHVNPLGLKSDAPMDVIWDIMRTWVKTHPVKAQPADQSGTVILSKEPKLQVNFARAVASLSKAQAKKVARFLPNPERHWGPKVRAGRQITAKHSSLLGTDKTNMALGPQGGGLEAPPITDEEEEEPEHKRQKIGDEFAVAP
ncbi:unnamed protein product [Spirodela intermedia]|uniref:tRNA (guanine(26)-N(2))-dimethyltransferase n=1 Tax=Spirodela intermedia TaxID=51605 RepID=A0A7I8KNG3_SPIIN|nr:unnamed protein product [Spirodela intermedia]